MSSAPTGDFIPSGQWRPARRRSVAAASVGLVGLALAAAAMAVLPGQARAGSSVASAPPVTLPKQEGVLVLKYFPRAADGQNIDVTVTGDASGSLTALRAKTDSITGNLVNAMAQGSRYHGYANASATSSLTYQVVDTKEYDAVVPAVANPSYSPPTDPYAARPDYAGIANTVNICDYVQNRAVDEVWMYAYQGPSQLQIDPSKMSGPNGDHSTDLVHGDLPVCNRTYTWYTFDYGLGTADALRTHSRQLEAELNALDQNTFTNLFEGASYPGNTASPGRCGSVDDPPNAMSRYDWANAVPHASDCPQWQADGTGPLSQVSCAAWSCADTGDADNAQADYLVWWMQNFPGMGNQVTLGGKPVRNWWEVHADFDAAVASGTGLVEPPPPSPTPTASASGSGSASASVGATSSASPTSSPSSTPTPSPTSSSIQYSFEDGALDGWSTTGHINSMTNSTAVGGQDGSHALQVSLYSSSSSDLPYVHVSPTTGPKSGQVLSAYLYIPTGTSATVTAKLFAVNPSNQSWMQGNSSTVTQRGSWAQLKFTLPSLSGSASQIGVQFLISPTNTNVTVYLDSVAWS